MATVVLGLINHTSISTAESTTGWTVFDVLDTDIKKEGSNGIAGTFRADATHGFYNAGSAPVTAVDKHFRIWVNTISLPYLETEAGGGVEISFNDGSVTEYVTAFGSDTYDGGWVNFVIDMNLLTTLTLANVEQWGVRPQYTTNAKNVDNFWVDYLRYLDGYYATGGTSGDEIGLALIAARDKDDGAGTLRGYGVLIAIEGVFFSYGELQIGNGSTTTWFKMDGDVIIFTDQPVAAGLYQIRAQGTGCRVDIKGSVIKSGGTTNNTRFILDFDDADLLSCSFTNNLISRAGICNFKSGQTVTGNTFENCGQITPAGADMTGCIVKLYEGTADTSALIYDVNADPDGELDNMSFEKGTAATHAIEFGTNSPLTMTLTGISFSGYNASNGQTDSTLHIKRTSGTVTINLTGCTGDISYKSDGATVSLVRDPRQFKFTLSPSITGYEWRIYSVTTLGSLDGATELDGQETATQDNQSYSYTYSSDVYIAVQIIAQPDEDYEESITYYTLKDSNQDLTITLKKDNNN